MNKFLLNSRAMCLLGAGSLLLACGPAGLAADRTWDGGDTTPNPNWSAVLNWDGDTTAPVSGDNLIFTGGSQTVNTNDIAGLSLGWLNLTSVGSDFGLYGSSLTLSGGITNAVGANTVGIPLVLGGAQSWDIASGSSLSLASTLSLSAGALSLTGDGDSALAAAAVVSGGGSLTKNGAGVLDWNSVGNTLTGGIVINGGTVRVHGAWASSFFGNSSPRSITINSGGTLHNPGTHNLGGLGASFYQPYITINSNGTWQLDAEQYVGWSQFTLTAANITGRSYDGIRCNGGILTNNASDVSTTISAGINMVSSGTLFVADGAAADDMVISGELRDPAILTKAGPGRLALSGITTSFASQLAVSAGTAALSGSALMERASISVASNAVLDVAAVSYSPATNGTLAGFGTVLGTVNDNIPGAGISAGGTGTAGTLTIDTLTLSGNLALNFDLVTNNVITGGATNDLLVVTNLNLSTFGTNTVNLNALAGALTKNVPYTLIKYTTCNLGAGAVTTLATPPSHFLYSFTNDTANSRITLTVSGNPFNLVWKGDGLTNSWDITVSTNWLVGGVTPDLYYDGDNATFTDTGSNTPPVYIPAVVKPTTLTFNATKDYTVFGPGYISGGARLVKSNSGNVTLLTANDFNGGGLLTGSGAVNVGNGGTTGAIGSGNLTNNARVNFTRSSSLTYAGAMSGNGSVNAFMQGATLTLTGSNSFTGGLTISNGTVQIGTDSAANVTGNITNYGTLNVYRSTAFTNQNNITSAGNTLLFGNGDINVRGAGGMTVDGSASINTLPAGSLSIGQSATGKLTVNSGGSITLGGGLYLGNPGSISGSVIQNGGTVSVTGDVRIGHWGSELSFYTLNGGTFDVPNNTVKAGEDGIGIFTMTGGILNARTLTVDGKSDTAAIGGTNETLNLTGGLLNIGSGGITTTAAGNSPVTNYNVNVGNATIAAVAPAGFSSSLTMNLTNGSPTFDSSVGPITLSGVLAGNGGLTKQGAGVLNLNGATTYTNTTTVAAGTLQGTGSIVSPLVVQSAANLSAGGTLATGTFTASNVTVNAGANMVFDASSTAATSDLLFAKGTLALDAATPAYFNFLGGKPFTGTPYTVVSNLGARTGSLVLAPSALTRYAATVDETNPNRIQVSFTGTNADLVWKGNLSSAWDVNTTSNWLNGASSDKYFQSDAVIFDSTGIASPNISLATPMSPASVMVNAAGNYSFGGAALSGVGTLTKNGSGTLTISNNLTHTGGTFLNAGTLSIGNGGTVGSIAGNITAQSSVVFNRSDTVTYPGVISGPGRLTQAGSGTLLITGTQTHFGGTTINPGGTIQMGNGPLADLGSLGNGTVTNNGTVVFYRTGNIGVATPYTGAGNFIFQGTGVSGQSGYVLNATNTFTGPVTLNFSRLQSGLGAQSFGSPSSITVNPGSQVYAAATAVSPIYNIPLTLAGTGWQDGLGALRIESGATWAGNITLANHARIHNNTGTSNTITGTITGNYELESRGGNATAILVLAPSAPNSYNALRISSSAVGAKTIAGNANAIPNNIPLTMNSGSLALNGSSKSFSSYVSLNAGSQLMNGSAAAPATATLVPALGTSSYNMTNSDGGSQPLNVTLTQSPGLWTVTMDRNHPNWTGNFTNNGGTVTCNLQNTGFGSQSVAGRNIVGNNGAVFLTTINNALNGFNGNMVLNNSTWINNRFVGFAASAGSLSLNNSTVNGTNNTDGAGFLSLRLPSTVTVSGSAPSYLLGSGTGAGFGLGNNAAGTIFDVADTTGNANADLVVAPLIYGSGRLVKTGPGTMRIESGFNNYTGSTIVSNGVLALGASAILVTSPNLIVLGNGKLDVSAPGTFTMFTSQTIQGNGSVIGDVTDGSGTTIAPGTSAGTLTFSNNLTLGGSGNVVFELANNTTVGGGVNDLVKVGGALNIPNTGGSLPITFSFLNGAPAAGTYTLFQAGSIVGDVTTLSNAVPSRYNASFTQVGNDIRVTFTGGVSNLVWGGDGGANDWDVNTTTNWFDGSSSNVFLNLDTVLFDDTSVNTTVNLGVTVQPGSVTVNSTNDYTITGAGGIAGSASITKNNTNTLTLATANTFSGPVNVTQGVLKAGNNNTLPVQSAVTVASGAQFDYAGFGGSTTRGYSFSIGGSGPDGSGAINNTGGGIFGNSSVSNMTLTADAVIGGVNRWDVGTGAGNTVLNGNGFNLVKVGAFGTSLRVQTITNVASITLSNGSAWYENFNQTNSWTATITNYIKPGTILGNYAGVTNNMPIVLDDATIRNEGGGNTPVWLGPVTIETSSVFNNGGAQNFYGPISGPGTMWVNGGTSGLTLTNASTYSGGTVISNAPSSTAIYGSASVVVKHPNALGTGPVDLNLAAYTGDSATNCVRPLDFELASGSFFTNDIIFPGTFITNVSLWANPPVSPSTFTLSGKLSGGHASLTNGLMAWTAANSLRLANPANDFLSPLIKLQWVTLGLAANNVMGNIGNKLRVDNNSGVTLRFDASGINLAHSIDIAQPMTIQMLGDNNGDGTPETLNNGTLSGVLSGSGSPVNIRGTNGVLTLTGNNTCSGSLELVEPAILQVAASTNLGVSAVALKAGTLRYTGAGAETMTRSLWNDNAALTGATIDVTSPTASLTWNPASGTCNQILNKTGAGALTLGTLGLSGGLNANGGPLTVNSVISGNSTVTVNNGASLSLNGANTHIFPTVVNNGSLYVNGSTAAGSPVSVSGLGSSVLGGVGSINGPVAVNAGATLQPGTNAIGKLTIYNSLTLAGSTTMEVSNTGSLTNDSVAGLVAVFYGGTLNVNNLGAQADLTNGVKFTLFNSIVRMGNFSSLTLPTLDPGLAWTNKLALDGSIEVVSAGPAYPPPTTLTNSIAGNQLTLSWPAGQGWRLLSQTNARSVGLTPPTNTWYEFAPAASNTVTVSIEKTNPTVFFRLMYP